MVDLKNRKHLFFDLDDTLWDLEKNARTVLMNLFEDFELENKLNSDFENFYEKYKKISHGLWRDYSKKQIDKESLRKTRFILTFKEFGHDDFKTSTLVNEQFLQHAPRGKHLKENCIEVLDYLQKDYTLHMITNGFKEVQQIKVDGCGLRNYFSNIVISEEHQLLKPDEKIFRLAESLANADPSQCVMIGDNFDCDVMGAKSAGWEAIYFSEKDHDYTGYSMKKLLELKDLF
jgi:putative hydrolase of the HAD superfamily